MNTNFELGDKLSYIIKRFLYVFSLYKYGSFKICFWTC